MGGGKTTFEHQKHEPIRIVPHPRTLRKAREQVKYMVIDGTSSRRIRNYLHRWVTWWAMTSKTWQYQELLQWFIDVCWHEPTAHYAAGLSQLHFKRSHTELFSDFGCCCISSASLMFLCDISMPKRIRVARRVQPNLAPPKYSTIEIKTRTIRGIMRRPIKWLYRPSFYGSKRAYLILSLSSPLHQGFHRKFFLFLA